MNDPVYNERAHFVVRPATLKGKWLIARRAIGGVYDVLCECRNETNAKTILAALDHEEYSEKLVKWSAQAAE